MEGITEKEKGKQDKEVTTRRDLVRLSRSLLVQVLLINFYCVSYNKDNGRKPR